MQNKIRNRIIEAIEINVSNPPFSDGGFSVYGVVIKRLLSNEYFTVNQHFNFYLSYDQIVSIDV